MLGEMPVFNIHDDAPRDAWKQWCLGIAFPILIAAYGGSCILLQRGTLVGRDWQRMQLSGKDAIAFGTAILAVALFLHAHYFLSNSERLSAFAVLGKVMALVAGIIGIGFVIVRNFSPL
jgi:hypothetical protein